ncbi:RNA-directed DNA polymerase, eukaryota, reverse transcriptase zinc-binding domain protein [Tanacetum coccineum]|uniref:RNA-directed DNA polymerase, eukaryota, reverse transcriptase zinc-binding domain protein n=1 Tax=Tanacetum coccineum TaxID=301880 RepID=A0ABQ5AM41_9ASTR
MKDLVANKLKTEEDYEIRMNPRFSAMLQNQLPSKEQDLGSFILHCSIEILDFNNALVDLGVSINIMSFSMYKRLGMGKLEPINMVIEMADNTKCTSKGIVKNLLVKIGKFIFPVDFVVLDMVEDIRIPIILGRPLLATTHGKESYEEVVYRMTEQGDPWKIEKIDEANMEQHLDLTPIRKPKAHWCKAISQEKESGHKYWAICDPYSNMCDVGDSPGDKKKRYWESRNDSERLDLTWEGLSLNDWMKIRFGYEDDDIEEILEDLEECREDKANAIIGAIHDKLNDGWFNETSEDKDDLEGILNYLEPKSYNGFIDLDDEAYNQRKCKLLGITYRKPSPVLIEKVEVIRYTIGPGETYIKIRVIGIDEMARTRNNVAAIRAGLMKEMAKDESG